jgi:hypothetical protein
VQRRRERGRVAVTEDVHVQRRGLGTQQVVVQRSDLDAVLLQLLHHRADLVLGQHKVAHDHGRVVAGLEREPGAEGKCRLDHHTIEDDVQVGPR